MVAKAVVKKVEAAAMYGVVSHMENTRSVDALVNKSTANYMLFIKKKSMSFKRGFTVYDEVDKKKYVVKTDALPLATLVSDCMTQRSMKSAK